MQIAALTTLRRRYDDSGIPHFLSWWFSELTSLLPERVRVHVRTGPRQLRVVPGSEGLDLWFSDEGAQRRLGQVELEADPAVARQQLHGLLERLGGDEPDMVLALPADNVLRHVVSLPEAAAENMREVLTFEMDRHTPFSAADVYFDFRVVGRHPATGKLDVEMVLVRRSDVDPAIEQSVVRGVRLAGVDVLDKMENDGPVLRGVNFLPEEQRARRRNVRAWINAGLVLLGVILLAGIMWQSLANKQRGAELLAEQVAIARADAVEVAAMRDQLDQALEGASFLIQQRLSKPTTMEMLRVLTDLLPDDVWLQRFEVQDTTMQIQGEAPNASALIAVLEDSPMFAQAAFRSPVTRNQANDKERFSITAELELPVGETLAEAGDE